MYRSVQNLDYDIDFNNVSLELTNSSVRLSIAKNLIPYLSVGAGTRVDLLCNPFEGLRLVSSPRSPITLQYNSRGLFADFDYTSELDQFLDSQFHTDLQDEYLGLYPESVSQEPEPEEPAQEPAQALLARDETAQAERTVAAVFGTEERTEVEEALGVQEGDHIVHETLARNTTLREGMPCVIFERTRPAREYPITVLTGDKGKGSRKLGLSLSEDIFRKAGFVYTDELSSVIFQSGDDFFLKVYRGQRSRNLCKISRLNPIRLRIDVPVQDNSPTVSGTQKGIPVSSSRVREDSITVRLPYPREAYDQGCHVTDVKQVSSGATSAELVV